MVVAKLSAKGAALICEDLVANGAQPPDGATRQVVLSSFSTGRLPSAVCGVDLAHVLSEVTNLIEGVPYGKLEVSTASVVERDLHVDDVLRTISQRNAV